MDKKVTSILSYLGILWLVAFFAGDKENAKFHLNQGLVLLIFNVGCSVIVGILSGVGTAMVIGGSEAVGAIISLIASIISFPVSIACLVFMIMGIVAACNDQEKALPIIGKFQILK